MLENSISLPELLAHPYEITDLFFVVAACLTAVFSQKGCAYKKSNQYLASQFMLAIGFSTTAIALGFKDGAYFDWVMMAIYLVFYFLITRTGDRFLGGLSLIISGYHFSIISSGWMSLSMDEILELEYAVVMNGFMVLQLILAFLGVFYGLHARLFDTYKRRYRHVDGNK